MTVPGIVEDALGGAEPLTRVSLSGDDELYVTPERTVVYRAGGVLSDEAVEEYHHDVDRLSVAEGRRKATVTFEYPVDDPRGLSIPKGDLEAALQPVLASVLRASGATDPDERVQRAFRLSELTLVVTSDRLFKHVGSALWDDEYDDYHFEDVSNVDYESGDVATGVVLTVDGRKQRIKTPNDRFPEVRRALESALFAYHDVSSAEELGDELDDEADPGKRVEDDPVVSFGEGVDPIDAGGRPGTVERVEDAPDAGELPGDADPLEASSPEESARDVDDHAAPEARADADPALEATDGESSDSDPVGGSATQEPNPEVAREDDRGAQKDAESGSNDSPDTPFTEDIDPAPEDQLREEVRELRTAVERQNELLQRQQRAIERLVEELRGD